MAPSPAPQPDGGTRWSFPLGQGSVSQGVAFGADGTLYVGTTDGVLWAIGP